MSTTDDPSSALFPSPLFSFDCFAEPNNKSSADHVDQDFRVLEPPTLLWPALSAEHRHRHVQVLRSLQRCPTADSVIKMIELKRTRTPWKWSTTDTFVGTMCGALARAESYSHLVRFHVPIALLRSFMKTPQMRDYRRLVLKGKLAEPVNFPLPLTAAHCQALLEDLWYDRRMTLLVLILLAWATAARLSCVLRLRRANIHLLGDALRVKFVEGKGVWARGAPYTVHTSLNAWVGQVQMFLAASPSSHLFDAADHARLKADVRTALRTLNPQYEQRSLRRGSLTALAEAGASSHVLMHFSGHTNERTLLRYLNWGWHHGEMRTLGTAASLALWARPRSQSA